MKLRSSVGNYSLKQTAAHPAEEVAAQNGIVMVQH